MCSALARVNTAEKRRKKQRSHSVFPQLEIAEETEEDNEIDNNNVETVKIDIDMEISNTSGRTTSQMLEEVDKRRKLRREKKNRKRATVMVTSGAMTFLLMAATLVTATFLMSPTIEKIFSGLL